MTSGIALLAACRLAKFAHWIRFVAVLARRGDTGPNRFWLPSVDETT
ncbi:hypothetical protein [Methylobacterium sp. ARG-1]|nr:hypothetical protein [Methylobacterium sp. ARG-1]